MSFSVGSAASSPLAYWQRLLQMGGAGGSQSQSFDPLASLMQSDTAGDTSSAGSSSGASASSTPPFGQGVMAQLIALQQQASAATTAGAGSSGSGDPGDAKFFAKLDTNGDGSVSQSEFEAATSKHGISTSIADAVFGKIDSNGDGSISQSELAAADKGRGHYGHHAHGAGGSGQGGGGDADDLMAGAGADGSTTQTVTNADGSTTTTITYADGSKVDMTSAASSAASGGSNTGSNGGSSNGSKLNLIEQLIKLQSQAIGAATSTLSAVA